MLNVYVILAYKLGSYTKAVAYSHYIKDACERLKLFEKEEAKKSEAFNRYKFVVEKVPSIDSIAGQIIPKLQEVE